MLRSSLILQFRRAVDDDIRDFVSGLGGGPCIAGRGTQCDIGFKIGHEFCPPFLLVEVACVEVRFLFRG